MSIIGLKKRLRTHLLQESNPLLIGVDERGCIEHVVGEPAHYGYVNLVRGIDAFASFDFLVGTNTGEKVEYPFLETPNGRCARIEVDFSGKRGVIMFFESTDERRVLQDVVKSSNENAIAQYRTEEATRRYQDLQIRHERTEQALRWADGFKSDVTELLKRDIAPRLTALGKAIDNESLSPNASLKELTVELQRAVASVTGDSTFSTAENLSAFASRRHYGKIAMSLPAVAPVRLAVPMAGHHVDAIIVGSANRNTEKLIGELATRGFLVQTGQPTPDGIQDVLASRPRLVFIEVSGAIDRKTAFENLQGIRDGLDYQPAIIVISEDDDFATRELAHTADVTAFFTMPLRIKNLMPVVNEALEADSALPPSILLMTNDPGYAEMFGNASVKSHLDIAIVNTPEDALMQLQEKMIDGVLVDCLSLPLVGRNFIRLVRQHETLFSIPIYALTEGRSLLDTERALASLADKCHPKWKDFETLIEFLVTGTRRHRRSQSLSRTDFLTGLLTRAVFLEQLEVEISRVNRGGTVGCLAIVDIDYFKQVNDRYGHHGGDVALRAVAMSFLSRLRKTDIVARYAGDEITIFLPDTDLASAEEILETIRREICDNPIRTDDKQFNISISCGLIEMGRRAPNSITAEWAMHQADLLLYEAKAAGRNRIVSRGW